MIRFGIIGLGKIAGRFAEDLALHPEASLQAVASRSTKKARAFAKQYEAVSHYGSYDALFKDSEVDVVYVATPNHLHYQQTMDALEAGKHVICEKPFALDATQVKKMINKAKAEQLFLMEALWTRFIPATEKVLELIGQGVIGQPVSIRADFGFPASQDPNGRLFNRSLGGGSLMDIGIYPLYLSYLLLGRPEAIDAEATMHYTGVDSHCHMELSYDEGQSAILESTFLETTPTEAIIEGTEGGIYMHPRFHHCQAISIEKNGTLETLELPYMGRGYYHEIDEVVSCLKAGKIQSEKMAHKHSMDLISLLDAVRSLIDLRFD
ncbi:Gfo/Idh/MocA family protein [Gilvibacter sediminis]|uniref:Gfo/Idh/MocA family protein n=1 Tax=Gilvibacter sediminis TaxID=379071 RepID=UPI00234FB8FC|nr:Gfo/Idh/MocA family oxidoreductase [Gilvibacter sediminis]MDC7997751.1 Gfo/Idh/MocA family oxidoreductase [Gilvibacter sediminis]